MALKLKFDIENDNFNNFFHKIASLITDKQREVLPKELYFKLFKRGGDYDTSSTCRLSFLAKLYILIKAARKRVIIMVEDEQNGMDEEEYFKYKTLLKSRQFSISNSETLIEDAVFVLGNKELMDTHAAINELSCSNSYNYLTKAKNTIPTKTDDFNKHSEYVLRFLTNYESQRKLIHMNSGLNMSEWLVLMALYNGKEIVGSSLYHKTYKYTFNSSKTKIKVAFGTLEAKGYIDKFGKSNGMKMRISVLGKDKVNEIVSRFSLLM